MVPPDNGLVRSERTMLVTSVVQAAVMEMKSLVSSTEL